MPRPRVLVAEDDLELSQSLVEILVSEGLDVTAVTRGDDALGELSGGGFDLVITDVMMPSPLGVQVAAMARTAGEGVPILVITASRDAAIPSVVSQLDRARLLLKPFSRTDLIRELAVLLPRDRAA